MTVQYDLNCPPPNCIVDIGKNQRNYIHDTATQKKNDNYLRPIDALKLQHSSYLDFDHYSENVDRVLSQITKDRPSTTTFLQHISIPSSIPEATLPSMNIVTLSSNGPLSVQSNESLEGIVQKNASLYSDMVTHYQPHQFYHHHHLLSSIKETNSLLQRPKVHSIQDINSLLQIVPSSRQQTGKRYQSFHPTAFDVRYIRPTQTPAEQTIDPQSIKADSYGHIDPFGVRRIVYYNASPTQGFTSRNNN